MDKLEGGEVEPVQQVNIYIEQQFTGNFKAGNGKYSIVLELETTKGTITREHYKGYRGTTKNRLAILACIEALSHLTKPCEVTIRLYSPYMEQSAKWLESWVRQGLDDKKNSDLWKKYYKLSLQHLVTVKNEKTNTYTPAMKMQLETKEMLILEDYQPENEV